MEPNPSEDASPPAEPVDAGSDRRDFMQKAACVVLGGVATAAPIAAGLNVVVSPLFEKTSGGLLVRITTLDSLPPDGPPQLFKVVTERKDAWTRHPLTEVGSVFIQRTGEGTAPEDFRVFNASCPHLGCAVEYLGESDNFSCPCHDSTFGLTGEVLNPNSPSPRGLDSLEIEVRENEVWVNYQNFKANIKEKEVIA